MSLPSGSPEEAAPAVIAKWGGTSAAHALFLMDAKLCHAIEEVSRLSSEVTRLTEELSARQHLLDVLYRSEEEHMADVSRLTAERDIARASVLALEEDAEEAMHKRLAGVVKIVGLPAGDPR